MSTLEEKDIINKFRDMVAKRYEFDELSARFDLPHHITEQVILEIKEYFLDSIYPESVKREELEAAFAGLGSYVRSPKKIWGLLGNMSRAIFQFGRQFPTALRAGMNALDAFMGAKNFEAEMVEHGRRIDISPAFTDEEFEKLMAQLPKRDIERFITDVRNLFKIMTNTKLIEKTIHILDNVVRTMEKKSRLYPREEVDGILLGRGILENGFELFSKYDEATKHMMVEVIYKNEMWFTDYVFDKWNN